MYNVVEKIVAFLVEKRLINISDFDLYSFGLECIFLKVLHYLSYLFIALILKIPLEALIIGITFICIRTNAGGYHAKSRTACYIISCFSVFVTLIVYKVIVTKQIYLILFILSSVILFLMSPVDNENRRFSSQEERHYKFKSYVYIFIFQLITIFCIIFGFYNFSYLCILGLTLAAILVLLGVLTKKQST